MNEFVLAESAFAKALQVAMTLVAADSVASLNFLRLLGSIMTVDIKHRCIRPKVVHKQTWCP